jgi:hypothetical protein
MPRRARKELPDCGLHFSGPRPDWAAGSGSGATKMTLERPTHEHAVARATVAGPVSDKASRSVKALLAGGALIVVIGLFLSAYSGAFANPQPRHIPVAVVAPSAFVGRLETSATLKVRPTESLSQARMLVRDRYVYGALALVKPGRMQVDIASGAGRPVAVVLTSVAVALADRSGTQLKVLDLAPLSPHDPSGTVEFYSIVFLTIAAGVGAGVLGRSLGPVRGVNRAARRVLTLALYTATVSAVFVLIVDAGFAALAGNPGFLFLILWAYSTAVCLAITGIAARVGTSASLFVILVMVALGNTSAGGPVPRPLLNGFFSRLTPIFPQGAGITMVRGVQYFGGYGLRNAAPTLAVWGGVGLLLLSAAALRRQSAAALPPNAVRTAVDGPTSPPKDPGTQT